MLPESVLLICLTPEESDIIHGLVASFEIDLTYREVRDMGDAGPLLSDTNVCMVILHLDEARRRPVLEIRQLRRLLTPSLPIMILVPPELASKVRSYLRAGADDYWVLPLDETAFPVRFYVLLEYGQALAQRKTENPPKEEKKEERPVSAEPQKKFLWQRVWGRLRNGFNFFSPQSLAHTEETPVRKWERLNRLGAGGFGEVWLVREREKETVAVAKIPHSPKLNMSILRSAAILKRLSLHPNVVHLIEVLKEEGKVVLIQEYIPGPTLHELLEVGMNAARKEKAFRQLAEVTAYAHEHKIIHRDIKPENVIISPSGTLKLLDFGIAKDMSRRSVSNTVVGSRPFMAPEQIMGKSGVGSDVWALGVTLYLMVTRCLPFYNQNEKYLMDMILETRPTPPRELEPDIPEELERIILESLEKDPAKRYPDAGEFCADLLATFPDLGKGGVFPEGWEGFLIPL